MSRVGRSLTPSGSTALRPRPVRSHQAIAKAVKAPERGRLRRCPRSVPGRRTAAWSRSSARGKVAAGAGTATSNQGDRGTTATPFPLRRAPHPRPGRRRMGQRLRQLPEATPPTQPSLRQLGEAPAKGTPPQARGPPPCSAGPWSKPCAEFGARLPRKAQGGTSPACGPRRLHRRRSPQALCRPAVRGPGRADRRGHTREAVAAAVRGRCRALRQKVRFQASILPVSEAALSLTRSFQVPFATSEEALTV